MDGKDFRAWAQLGAWSEKNKVPIVLELDGPGGNSLNIVSRCMRAARKAGWPHEAIDFFKDKCLSVSREQLLDLVFTYFEPMQQVSTYAYADRDSVS